MNTKQALAEARKRLGADAAVRDNPKAASTPERRAVAKAQMRQLVAVPLAERDGRWFEERDKAYLEVDRYRYAIGRNFGGMLVVRGEGDTWEEALAKVESAP